MANQPRTSSTVRPQVRTVGSVRKVEVSRLGSAAGPTGGRGAPSSDAQVERLCTAAVQAVAARARQLTTAQPGWPWAEILGTTDRPSHAGAAAATPGAAVLANLAALAAAPTVADYAILTELLEHLGGRELARLQHQRATPVEPDDSLPIASLFTLALSPAVYAPIFEAAGQQVSDDLRDRCAEVSLRLMLQDMPAGPPDPPLTTVEDFLRCFELETLPGWRRHLVRYALDPWSPYTHQLLDLAEQTGNP
ncbi:MAG TPA: hypothetical protein VNS46_21360, partial [Nocardioides sp.]|nr:hypothetical protein [Nocardioides sp.]